MSENGMIVADAIKRIDEVLNLASLSEPEKAKHPKVDSVEFDHVTFRYDDTKNALEDISLRIAAGQMVAFGGSSGGGKSTLAIIAARFFDPQEGRVLIGGVDVRDIPKQELMRDVSFVFQNSHLIKASILDNVRLGKLDATMEEVMEALRAAQCMDIIEKFPQGVHTMIGSQGVYLSGGETQRIAVARALLKNSPIIILDEATASLDVENETAIQKALSQLIQNKTVLIITHRMRTVSSADQIIVLKDGLVAEKGTPQDLLKQSGIFSHMVKLQTQSQSWTI